LLVRNCFTISDGRIEIKDFCCWLLVVSCYLLVVSCWLLVVGP